jgi:signal transduction histidine kinase
MARLIDDLLDVNSIVMGKSTLAMETLDLADVVTRLLQTWRDANRLSVHQVSLRVSPVCVRADRARVEQIVSNLLDNALKFTPAGKRISIDVHREGAQARIVVVDEGAGIAPADIERVFELFVQGPQDLSRQRGGIGVGLALVKRLVEMQGGRVIAESGGTGCGAVFTVVLPAQQTADDSQPAPAAMPRRSRAPLLRVLLVEETWSWHMITAQNTRLFSITQKLRPQNMGS